MASGSGSASQFQLHTSVGIGEGPASYTGTNFGNDNSIPDVMPLSARTATTSARSTAWRLHRNRNTAPQPLSKETAGSVYRWPDQ